MSTVVTQPLSSHDYLQKAIDNEYKGKEGTLQRVNFNGRNVNSQQNDTKPKVANDEENPNKPSDVPINNRSVEPAPEQDSKKPLKLMERLSEKEISDFFKDFKARIKNEYIFRCAAKLDVKLKENIQSSIDYIKQYPEQHDLCTENINIRLKSYYKDLVLARTTNAKNVVDYVFNLSKKHTNVQRILPRDVEKVLNDLFPDENKVNEIISKSFGDTHVSRDDILKNEELTKKIKQIINSMITKCIVDIQALQNKGELNEQIITKLFTPKTEEYDASIDKLGVTISNVFSCQTLREDTIRILEDFVFDKPEFKLFLNEKEITASMENTPDCHLQPTIVKTSRRLTSMHTIEKPVYNEPGPAAIIPMNKPGLQHAIFNKTGHPIRNNNLLRMSESFWQEWQYARFKDGLRKFNQLHFTTTYSILELYNKISANHEILETEQKFDTPARVMTILGTCEMLYAEGKHDVLAELLNMINDFCTSATPTTGFYSQFLKIVEFTDEILKKDGSSFDALMYIYIEMSYHYKYTDQETGVTDDIGYTPTAKQIINSARDIELSELFKQLPFSEEL